MFIGGSSDIGFCAQTCESKFMEKAPIWNLKVKILTLKGRVMMKITKMYHNSWRYIEECISKSKCSFVARVILDFCAQTCKSKLMQQTIIWNLKVIKKRPKMCHKIFIVGSCDIEFLCSNMRIEASGASYHMEVKS